MKFQGFQNKLEKHGNVDTYTSVVLGRHTPGIMKSHYDVEFDSRAAEKAVSNNSELWGLGPTTTQTKREQDIEAIRLAAKATGPQYGPLPAHLITCRTLITTYRCRSAVFKCKNMHFARDLPADASLPIYVDSGVFLPDPAKLNNRPTIYSGDAFDFVCSCCNNAVQMELADEDIDDEPIVGYLKCVNTICTTPNSICYCSDNVNAIVHGFRFKPTRPGKEIAMKRRKF